jgi:hypothetical protein
MGKGEKGKKDINNNFFPFPDFPFSLQLHSSINCKKCCDKGYFPANFPAGVCARNCSIISRVAASTASCQRAAPKRSR